MKFILFPLMFVACVANATTILFPKVEDKSEIAAQILIHMDKIEAEVQAHDQEAFTVLKHDEFRNSEVLGEPALPVASFLLRGHPEEIKIQIKPGSEYVLPSTKPMPAQQPDCRCQKDLVKSFAYDKSAYDNSGHNKSGPGYRLTYLGAYRGQPVTRLEIQLAQYNAKDNSVTFKTAFGVAHNSRIIEPTNWLQGSRNRYLIVTPSALAPGVNDYVAWRRSLGYQMTVEQVASPNNTTQAIRALIEKHYKNGIDFVLMIGDETSLPMYRVSTSFSSQTPSDHPYFILDGNADTIPDVFYGRIAGNSPLQIQRELEKVQEYENKNYQDNSGEQKIIGIASNEGSRPSDDEYIQDIEQKFISGLGFSARHLHQDNPESNPRDLNKAFGQGASWVFYMGHGDGSAWPSMNEEYTTRDMSNMKNAASVKPIVIDVACQNGRLQSTRFGSTFHSQYDNGLGKASGVVGYYGGTVDIAWHPPAIMARGIAQSVSGSDGAAKATFLGQALFAGQLYLATQNNNRDQVLDNWEWYHLQGDPGMRL